ncbi:HAMP domain-containing protein [Agriterribacter sp.]|uniref:sensor histidine kinase n=1 Tax=Agriterribacter sp. TaxID=2821509 RepID=UPI002BB5D1A8|nr:HAMP domain-containing protein [Agriterribacter sp.]HRP56996.1 HAMP domain-containing protein [Agriterribacter sp.]
MMNGAFPGIKKISFSLQGLSLRQRIPLLICLLLCSVVAVFSLMSYLSVRSLGINAGKQRLINLTIQAGNMIEESLRDIVIDTDEAIAENVVLDYLKHGTTASKKATLNLLEQIGGDGSSVYAELMDNDFNTLLSAGRAPGYRPGSLKPLPDTSLRNFTNKAGNIYHVNDSIYFPVIIPVLDDKKAIAYIIRYRQVKITSKLIEQFSKLAGRGAALYVGNRDGSLWTNLVHPVSYQLPVSHLNKEKTFEYVNNNNHLIGAVRYIPDTPWIVVLEFPHQAFLQASTQFFNWLMIVGFILIGSGIIAAWLMSRNLTRPLNTLTAAAAAIAGGDYASTVDVSGGGEVAKLGESFNAMSTKLKSAQDIMKQQILEAKQMNEQLRHLSAHMEKVREEERLHIAREMHDELGQLLTGFKMDVYLLKRKLSGNEDPAITEKIRSLENAAGEAIQFVRKLSSELRLGPLEDLGLIAALEWYCGEFTKRFNIPVAFNSSVTNIQTSSLIKTGLFRIYQESLTNIARHAGATRVEVNFEVINDKISLTIRDNGKGFNADPPEKRKTLGLLGMNERAIVIGGSLKIRSAKGKGTIVEITVPIVKDAVSA